MMFWTILLAAFTVACSLQWIEIDSENSPSPRYYFSSTHNDQTSYLFGGLTYNGQYVPQQDLWKYDTFAGWKSIDTKSTLPPPRGYSSLNLVGNTLVLFGGKTEPPNEQYFNDTWIFDLQAQTWTQLSIPAPSERFFHTTTNVNGKLYLFGGTGQQSWNPVLNDTWMFDPSVPSWKQLTNLNPIPVSRQAHSASAYGDNVVVFGGRDGRQKGAFNDLWMFNTDNNTWALVSQSGPSRGSHAAAIHNDVLYVFGGTVIQSMVPFVEDYHNDLWTFDFTTSQWSQLIADSPISNYAQPWKRQGHRAFLHQQTLIVFGGYGLYQGLLNDTWQLTIGPNNATNTHNH